MKKRKKRDIATESTTSQSRARTIIVIALRLFGVGIADGIRLRGRQLCMGGAMQIGYQSTKQIIAQGEKDNAIISEKGESYDTTLGIFAR